MDKLKFLNKVAFLLVAFMGSAPGIMTLVVNTDAPFQRPEGAYWKALVLGVPSIVMAVIVASAVCRSLNKRWIKEKHSNERKAIFLFLIVILAGLASVLAGWESNWIMAKLTTWSGVGDLQWIDFIKGIPIMLIYTFMPVTVAAFILGLFSYVYLRFSK